MQGRHQQGTVLQNWLWEALQEARGASQYTKPGIQDAGGEEQEGQVTLRQWLSMG